MLTIPSGQHSGKTCDGHSRRNFPRLGGLCVAGRPALGSVVSRLEADAGSGRLLPPYVQLHSLLSPPERLSFPAYLGGAHKPFIPGKSLKTLTRSATVSSERLRERRQLLQAFD